MFLFQTQALPAFDAHTFVFTACVAFGLEHSRLRDLPFWKRNSESVTEYGAFPGRTLGALAAGQLLSSERCSASKDMSSNESIQQVSASTTCPSSYTCVSRKCSALSKKHAVSGTEKSSNPQFTRGLENGGKHAISVVSPCSAQTAGRIHANAYIET